MQFKHFKNIKLKIVEVLIKISKSRNENKEYYSIHIFVKNSEAF